MGRNGEENRVDASLIGKKMEEVQAYKYLKVDISNVSKMCEELTDTT